MAVPVTEYFISIFVPGVAIAVPPKACLQINTNASRTQLIGKRKTIRSPKFKIDLHYQMVTSEWWPEAIRALWKSLGFGYSSRKPRDHWATSSWELKREVRLL